MAAGGHRNIEQEVNLGRTVRSEYFKFAKNGEAYVVSEELSNTSTGDTAAISLTNPDGSGTTAVFVLTEVAASAPSKRRRYFSNPAGRSSSSAKSARRTATT